MAHATSHAGWRGAIGGYQPCLAKDVAETTDQRHIASMKPAIPNWNRNELIALQRYLGTRIEFGFDQINETAKPGKAGAIDAILTEVQRNMDAVGDAIAAIDGLVEPAENFWSTIQKIAVEHPDVASMSDDEFKEATGSTARLLSSN